MSDKKLLIVDDEENMRHMLSALLARCDYEISSAGNGSEALEIVADQKFDFILCDVKMPVMDGMEFLERAEKFIEDSTVIMMSAYGSIDLALQAMNSGAYDFISKPFKTDEVLLALKKAEEREQLRSENLQLRQQIETIAREPKFYEMVSVSKSMREVFDLANKVAQFDTTVLITGESGTGKELIARGIHQSSPRKEGGFVAVNCGGLPENLLESELFGHVKGAFTGAESSHNGLFREAHGGTLLLDEIGDLPLQMQVKLLRVLQEQEIRPVGSSRSSKVDVRVLAATSTDLEDQVANNKFREDLFYRLNVVRVRIPPLRNRKEDVDHLCHHFVKKFNKIYQVDKKGFTDEALTVFRRYDWPGNVRELENAVQRGLVMSPGDYIDIDNVPAVVQSKKGSDYKEIVSHMSGNDLSVKKAQKELEKQLIEKALMEYGGNKSKAAKALEISYPSLLSKIKAYKIGAFSTPDG